MSELTIEERIIAHAKKERLTPEVFKNFEARIGKQENIFKEEARKARVTNEFMNRSYDI